MATQDFFVRSSLYLSVLALTVGACVPGVGTSSAFAATFSGSVALTSDYVWRGSSQSDGDPAAQAGFKASTDAGWYGSLWGSAVKFPAAMDAHSEFDLSAGWSGSLTPDFTVDLNLTNYRYPSTAADLDWVEAIATLTLKQNQWLTVGYSNNALASGERGTYAQIGTKIPLSNSFRLEAAAGYYWLDIADQDGYAHTQLSGIWVIKAPLELRVTAHAAVGDAKRLFPGAAGTRAEVALQTAF